MQTPQSTLRTATARRVTLALGFGTTPGRAVAARRRARWHALRQVLRDYEKGWERYDRTLNRAAAEAARPQPLARRRCAARTTSANVVKATEDKTFPGAIVASLASPWGQAVSAGDPNNTYFGSYREVFARDLYEAWTGLLTDGDLATARAATLFLFQRQQLPDGSMPRNSLSTARPRPTRSTPSSTRSPTRS